MKRIIAGDIGGTSCRLMLAQTDADRVVIHHQMDYPGQEFADFETVLARFFEDSGENVARLDAACFALAGPIRDQQARLTNLPWTLDARHLQQQFGLGRVELINDFAANGYSLDILTEGDYRLLQTGEGVGGNRLVLGAGTGLGVAQVIDAGGTPRVLASEGGHMDFAPNNARQSELLDFLRQELPRVSYEHVLSGKGLVRLYRYVSWQRNVDPSSLLAMPEPAAEISRRAMSDEDPLADDALQLFFQIYGSCAANLALMGLASGGVYLAGGIAARLAEALMGSGFMAAFNDKPPMSELLQRMPVRLITNQRAGLLGAAWYAANHSATYSSPD